MTTNASTYPSKLYTMGSEAANLAYAYCLFDGRIGYEIEMASTLIILSHDIMKAGGVVLSKEEGEDFVSMRVQLQGEPVAAINIDRVSIGETRVSVSLCDTYSDNNSSPI